MARVAWSDGVREQGTEVRSSVNVCWVCVTCSNRLHDEIVAFFEFMTPTPEERHARAMVIAQVADVVKRRLPTAAVDTFGSVAQDLYLPDGDTDLVITTPHTYDDETKKRVLFQLAALMRNTRVTDRVQVVARARVPVISFQTSPDLGSLKIDISLNAADGLRAVPILRDYFTRMPALRYLVLALKCLLSRHGLNSASSSGLSSYGLICLAISFLQLNPKGRPPAYIEQPLQSESLGVLLMDFLEYYADAFPYGTSYVSVTQGKLLPKEEKGWANTAHPESLCIECLLNPENDVGRPTSKIQTIRALFREARGMLEAYAFTPTPASYNILGAIIGISESVRTLSFHE
ncbi:Nucleotidyltransferase [Trametes cingulata]|nr:Nucleotidyltransferase [Trametes cingulata]